MLFQGSFLLLCCLAAPGADAAEAEPLRPGAALEGRLAGGEVRRYAIPLEQDAFLRITISQDELDVVATLRDPAGQVLARADAMAGLAAPEIVTAVVAAAGSRRRPHHAGRHALPPRPGAPAAGRRRRPSRATGRSRRRDLGHPENRRAGAGPGSGLERSATAASAPVRPPWMPPDRVSREEMGSSPVGEAEPLSRSP
jgi:hypothetical protein